MHHPEAAIPESTGRRVAVPEWRGRVSPVFDVAEQVRVVDIDRQGIGHSRSWSLTGSTLHERARQLANLHIDVLICGAISWPLEALLTAQAIQVISFVCGEIEEVLQAFRDGTLPSERFAMPGCCRRRQQVRGRCQPNNSIAIHKERS
jgi:predicted Fe-Mo cluster-binding NifX family protein